MYVMMQRRICEEKMNQLRNGNTAYAESPEIINRMKREIEKENLKIHIDYTNSGCYFIPLPRQKSS